MITRLVMRSCAWIAVAVLGGFLALPALGTTFIVNSALDVTDANPGDGACETATGNGICTLRAAIQEANAHPGADTIILPAGTYTLTIPGAGEIAAASGDLDITDDLTITGAGAAVTIVQACAPSNTGATCTGIDRVFHVDPRGAGISVQIIGITVQNGRSVLIPFISSNGGGILLGVAQTLGAPVPSGHLTLTDCVVGNNASPRDGGGIFNNAGVLALIRTTVTANFAGNGGGISNGDTGILNLTGSTVSANFADQGGGIFSGYFDIANATKIAITNSTISGNTAGSGPGTGFGGGMFINRGTMAAVNTTISNNTSFYAGGGIITGGSSVSVNNSTIAFNVAGSPNAGGYGAGFSGLLAASNTILSNNTVLGSPSDCNGTINSGGYNLVQSTAGCTITGITTGNVVGNDAKLGLLADNGGPAKTHALIAGSPAIDAGNPAVPGSAVHTCAVSDQRGYLRPQGAACDIGAFERVAQFSVTGILPNSAARTGATVAFISGNGFAPGASVALRRAGQSDIVGKPVTVEGGSSGIATVFDLSDQAVGVWDLVVTNPDATSAVMPGAFTIDQQSGVPQLWVSLVGATRIHPGGTGRMTIFFGNRGNTDAIAVPLSLAIPQSFTGALLFPIINPPVQPAQVPTAWAGVPTLTRTPDVGFYNFNLLLSVIPGGYTGTLQVELAAYPTQEGFTFQLFGSLGQPLFQPTLDSATVTGFVTGARAYAQRNLAVTIPTTIVPQMNQYLTTDLEAIVRNGRNALVASFGTQTQVYSLGQISFDLARFGAAATAAAGP